MSFAIMKIAKKTYFKLLSLLEKEDFPSRHEVAWCKKYIKLNRSIIEAMKLYGEDGKDIGEIAIKLNCTRERAKQMIKKGVRAGWESFNTFDGRSVK